MSAEVSPRMGKIPRRGETCVSPRLCAYVSIASLTPCVRQPFAVKGKDFQSMYKLSVTVCVYESGAPCPPPSPHGPWSRMPPPAPPVGGVWDPSWRLSGFGVI